MPVSTFNREFFRFQIIEETLQHSKNKYKYFGIDDKVEENKVKESLHSIIKHQEFDKFVSFFDKNADFGKIIIEALYKS